MRSHYHYLWLCDSHLAEAFNTVRRRNSKLLAIGDITYVIGQIYGPRQCAVEYVGGPLDFIYTKLVPSFQLLGMPFFQIMSGRTVGVVIIITVNSILTLHSFGSINI